MELKRMIVHKIDKKQHKPEVIITFRKNLLPANRLAENFMIEIDKAYNSRQKRKSFGRFYTDTTLYPFQGYLRSYLSSATDKEFIDFSINAAELLKRELGKKIASTGGNLFLMHYENDTEELVSAVVLSDKLAYVLNDKLELSGEINLDTEKVNMATMIKVSLIDNAEDLTYLSFIRGKKNVTDYFVDFIGCEDYQSPAKSTEKCVEAAESYMKDNKYDTKKIREVEKQLVDYFSKNDEVSLEAIANIINPQDPDSFTKYAAPYEINTEFQPISQKYKKFIRVEFSSKDLSLSFSKGLQDDGTIRYDEKEKAVIIKDRSGDIKKKLEQE